MIIDKTLNFATREELEEADELKTRYEKLIDELLQWTDEADREQDELAAKGYSKEEIKQIQTTSKQREAWATEWTEKLTETQDRTNTLSNMWIVRYIDSFNGNLEAILADAREVSDAITEQDYLTDHKQQEQTRRRKLERLSPDSSEAKDLQDLSNIGFSSCYRFLLDVLINQINAIIRYSNEHDRMQNLDLIAEIAANRALELYPPADKPAGRIEYRAMPIEDEPAPPAKPEPKERKPRKLSSEEIRAAIESDKLTARLIEQPFFTVPTSPAIESTLRLLSSRGNLAQMKERRPTVCHSQKIETFVPTGGGKGRKVTFETMGVSSISITISALDKLLHAPKAKKMFIYALKKINDQVFSGGELKRDYATFRLQELVDIGYYSTIQSARVGFKEAMETLTDIKVSGELREGKSKELKSDVLAPLFRGYDLLGKGVYCFYIEPRINWAMVCAFYTSLPRFYFELHSRASELLYFISVRARQCAGEIRQRGYITISMRAVQERLSLPSENEIKNPERDIKKPIMEAIAEINERSGESGNITLELIGSGKRQIADFLDNAYIKASIGGEYAVTFKEIAENQQKQIETAQKRREAITERAIAQNLAKKLESNAADQSGEPPKRKRGRPRKNQ